MNVPAAALADLGVLTREPIKLTTVVRVYIGEEATDRCRRRGIRCAAAAEPGRQGGSDGASRYGELSIASLNCPFWSGYVAMV